MVETAPVAVSDLAQELVQEVPVVQSRLLSELAVLGMAAL
jgi:hypothetical protein